MKTILLLIMGCFTGSLMAQKLPREVLNGQLVAETVVVDNVMITNKTLNYAVVSKKDGSFQIMARVKDTLVFSGFNFPRQLLILTEADFNFKVLKISIESQPTNLDEVIISPKALTGNLAKDAENIKVAHLYAGVNNRNAMDQLYFDDDQSSPDNKLMPGYLDPTYMVDFAKIGGKLVRAFKRSETQKLKNKDVSRFSIVVKNRFSDDFFRNTLKFNQEEVNTFLTFCESDEKAPNLIEKSTDFELIRFLESKAKEFRELKKE